MVAYLLRFIYSIICSFTLRPFNMLLLFFFFCSFFINENRYWSALITCLNWENKKRWNSKEIRMFDSKRVLDWKKIKWFIFVFFFFAKNNAKYTIQIKVHVWSWFPTLNLIFFFCCCCCFYFNRNIGRIQFIFSFFFFDRWHLVAYKHSNINTH